VKAKDKAVDAILDDIFTGTNVQYKMSDKQIILSVNTSTATKETQQSGQKVTGKVVDKNGEALPGVTIQIAGSMRGVITGENGNFEMDNIAVGTKLSVSLIGMQTKEFIFQGKGDLIIVLEDNVNELDEVTIVAFGKQKKSSVIASIETVKTADLKVPSSNMTSAFAGKIPGIISYQTTGEPGADNAQFFVRGVTTFGYKTSPLILIDGFEATTDDLARMQPDDIESFSILKDASATVLYGARGANGIIMVSTKAGHEGPVKINARVDVNVTTPTQIPQTLDGVDYMKLYNQAQISRTPELGTYYSEQKILSTLNGENPMIYPNINWYDNLFNKQTINTKANLNVSGGGGVARYFVSGGYENETGLLKVAGQNNFNNNIDIDRFHVRTNVIFKLSKTTTLDTRIQARFTKYNGPFQSAGDIFKMVMNGNPVDFPAVWEPDEANLYTRHILFGNTSDNTGALMTNPYAEMVRGYESRDENTITAMVTLNQDFDFLVKGLKFQAKVSANTYSLYSSRRTYSPYYYGMASYNMVTEKYKLLNLNPTTGQAYLGDVQPGRDATVQYYYEARLNWDRKFGDHSIGLMTVAMAQENLLTGGNDKSIYVTLPERNFGNSGRVTYDYDERYFFEFGYGYNGSEKFTGDKKFGFFPSLGAGWLVSNESFWAPMKNYIDLLKLKFTYGKVGNDAIAGRSGRFWFLSDLQRGGSPYRWGETFTTLYDGYVTKRYANPDISWEVSTKYNLGLELGLLKDAPLKFQIDFFKDYRNKIYMPLTSLPGTMGLEAGISGNVGKVESQGIDASLDFQHFFNKDFWMTARVNFTYATNKYVKLDEPNYPDTYLSQMGHNINLWRALVAERLFVDEEEIRNSPRQDFATYQAGDIKYVDVNGDGVVNGNDEVFMGYPVVPEIQYGFGLSAGYKHFDFSFFFQGNARVSMFIDPSAINPFTNRRNALEIVARDSWSETNPDVHAFWPRLSVDPLSNNMQLSSWWMRDASFLRLKSLETGYNFSKIKRLGLDNIRVYFSAENLFVISAFKMWDPEMGRNGLGYPLSRRFNLGVQLAF
jgi:TonB-linked SusC/RagA family outer membrane protein